MRLFFALWPPRPAASLLHEWASGVRSGGRVTDLEAVHLTLAFLGDVGEEGLSVLKNFQLKGERHSLPITQARYWKHNEIIWVGPEAVPEALALLARDLKDRLREKRFRTEKRPFAAHVTMIRKARDPGALPALPAVVWPVDEVVLVRSRLSGAGARHEVVQHYPLN